MSACQTRIRYTHWDRYSGNLYRTTVLVMDGPATITDEPYAPLPGDALRVVRNAAGRIVCGPLVSELVEWEVLP